MGTSRTASIEFAKRQIEQEQAAFEARAELKAQRRAAAERATAAYFAERAADADRRTRELDERVAELRGVLARGLRRPPRVDLAGLRRELVLPPLDLGAVGWGTAPPTWDRYEPAPAGALGRLVGGGPRHRRAVAAARAAYDRALAEHERAEADRMRRFADARARHRAAVAAARREVAEHNEAVDEFLLALADREPDAVCHHLELVLAEVALPRRFPRGGEVHWVGDRPSVHIGLPGPDVVPAAEAVRYDRPDDELHLLPRPHESAAELYRDVLGQVVLLCLHDLFAADPALPALALTGSVRGRELVSVRVDRAAFTELDLRSASLDQLGALVSAHPYELEPLAG
jgi:restriction system protein